MGSVHRSKACRWGIDVLAIALVAATGANGEPAGTAQRQTYAPLLDPSQDVGLVSDPKPDTRPAPTTPPANLVVPPTHRDLVQTMWERSATFRRQCQRIGREETLTVRVHLHPQGRVGDASTRLVKRSGAGLTADVHLGEVQRTVELLAHELEHIVERLEGIHVEQLARRAPDVVWPEGGGAYETRRAIEAGLAVALEVTKPRN